MRSALLPPPLTTAPAPMSPLRGCLLVMGCVLTGLVTGALVTVALHAGSEAVHIAREIITALLWA
jgi:hypothetical protein